MEDAQHNIAADLISAISPNATQEIAQPSEPVAEISVPAPSEPTGITTPEAAVPAQGAEAIPAPSTPAATPDPLDAYLSGQVTPEASWPTEALGLLKAELGFDTPQAIKQHMLQLGEEATLLKSKAQEADTIKAAIDSFPLELQNAINKQLQGEDGVAYLQNTKQGVSLSKDAKDIDSAKLVDAYFPGKFSAEQREAIKDGTADETLKAAHDRFAELATMEHNNQRTTEQGRVKAQEDARVKQREAVETSRAAAIAHLKNNKTLAALVGPDIIDKFSKGQLEAEYLYNPDGTYRPEALARLATIGIHDKIVERARLGARTEGRNEGILEATSGQPTKAAMPPATRIAAPAATDEQKRHEAVEQDIFKALAGQLQ